MYMGVRNRVALSGFRAVNQETLLLKQLVKSGPWKTAVMIVLYTSPLLKVFVAEGV